MNRRDLNLTLALVVSFYLESILGTVIFLGLDNTPLLIRNAIRAHDLEYAISQSRDLDRVIISSLNVTHKSLSGRTLAYGRIAPVFYVELLNLLLMSTLTHARNSSSSPKGQPIRGAMRIAYIAVAVLPREDRPRYTEEYRAELGDQAAAGEGWWRQVCYSGRLLSRAGALRLTLAQRSRRRREVI